ncbi:phasin family protein [Paenibacillus sp.]|uniref:phasin family protein n=1 Tax=Paenibacillus sp. TaxID=58172 RepID=UPI002D480139|nr:polyhydroxyalkanoate synthesis regulator [Paenibacillus sp.]HZG85667.1 polyhydroxyalkanoate synthesis regulator [Paenibacillus sp.]
MISEVLKKAVALGLGVTAMSKEKAERLVEELVRKGEVRPNESQELLTRLLQRGEEERSELKKIVQEQLRNVLAELRVATKEDVERLDARLTALEGAGGAPAVAGAESTEPQTAPPAGPSPE